jgi:pimeloyl-ACP methyl ester carboxylesterase
MLDCDWSSDVCSSDLALAILRGLGLGKTTLVGLSMGGYIAQLMAIEHPEVVDRLVLIATSADHRPYMAATMGQSTAWFSLPGPEQALIDYIHASIADPPRTPEQFSENLIRGWQVTYDGLHPFPREQVARALNLAAHRCPDQSSSYQHALAVGASADRLDAVKRIVAPTLVIHGRYDVCLPLPHGEYLARNIANARLRVFDMGHSFMWSWDDEVLSAILDFCT